MKIIATYIDKILDSVSTDIGIDLGTANTLVYLKGKGIVLNEPTIVAINKKTGQLVAVGSEAKTMLGRTPGHIEVIQPLKNGVISDFEVTEEMLAYLISKVREGTRSLVAPRVLIGVPSGITSVEMRAARDVARNAGARDVFLVEESISAAIGAKLPIHKPQGSMIIDIGGGTTDIAVISLNGIVAAKNLRIAGDQLNQDIVSYIKDQFKVFVGDKTAEDTKIFLASVEEDNESKEVVVRGRDVITGLPREVVITDSDIKEAINSSIGSIVEATRDVIELTPPEILSDIMQKGILLSGGGALIPGVSKLLERVLKLPVVIVPDPLRSVVRGIGIILENLDDYEEILIENEEELSPRL